MPSKEELPPDLQTLAWRNAPQSFVTPGAALAATPPRSEIAYMGMPDSYTIYGALPRSGAF